MKSIRWYVFLTMTFWALVFFTGPFAAYGVQPLCCPDDPEFFYLLFPKPSQRFQYLVRYETFFSTLLNKEKGFFIILPENYFQNPAAKYPVLLLLHGYNFHRTGIWWKVHSPEKAKRLLCERKEEEECQPVISVIVGRKRPCLNDTRKTVFLQRKIWNSS